MRMAALMAAGTFGLHQLRFALSGENAQAVHGHGYLTVTGPLLAGLLLLALTVALARAARGTSEQVPSLHRMWAGASAALIAVYSVQESIEGQHALFAHGGWVALPLAICIGFAIALVTRGSATPLAPAAPWRAPASAWRLATLLPAAPDHRASTPFIALTARGPPLISV
jgi:hypothetical protein